MSKLCVVVLGVVGLGVALMGATIGCGGGGAGGGGALTTFLANFLPSEVRIDQPLPASFADARQPTACCEGTTIYAVWEDYRNGESDILFNVSTNSGSTWQANNSRVDTGTQVGFVRAVRPTICCDGSSVYVAWVETMGFNSLNYYFNRSLDGGATWLPNRVKIDTHPMGLNTGTNPSICCAGNTVVVTWSDDRSGVEQIYSARSTDAGATWSEQQIGGAAGFTARGTRCCSEVVGMVHYVYVAWTDDRNGSSQPFFDRSTDGGATWGADVILDAGATFSVSDICCDTSHVYVTWLANNAPRTPRLRGSSDFGATFAATEGLKTAAGGIGAHARLCCEGMNVHAVFTDSTGGQNDVYYNMSADAGVTILAAQVRVDSGMAGDASSVPIVCCNGMNLVTVFLDDRSGTFDVWASRSTDAGATWSADVRLDIAGGAVSVQNFTACCDVATTYALYTDERDGPDRAQLQLNRSINNGANWFANDVRVSQANPPGMNATSSGLQMVAKGNTLHAVFEDNRLGEDRVFYNRSTDGGSTWMPVDVLLDPAMNGAEDENPVLCCSGNSVYVAWIRDYTATNFEDVYVNRSLDGGLTWLPAGTRVNTGVAMNSVNAGVASLCCVGANVYVVWNDGRNGDEDIFINRSADSGGTWLAAAVRIDNAAATFDARRPLLCCEGLRLHVVWEDDRDGNQDIYTNRSLDGGVTWQGADTRLDVTDAAGMNGSFAPRLCCHGTRVYVAWEDERNGDYDVYFAASADAGATDSPDQRLDIGPPPGMGDSEDIAICCEGARVFLVWVDTRAGNDDDLYFNRSLDGGATWLATDTRIDIGDPPGDADSDSPAICCVGDRVYIAWDEDRPANPGPYFTASTTAGLTWMPAPIRISGAPQPFSSSQQIVCSPSFIYVGWVRGGMGAQDVVVNRTPP